MSDFFKIHKENKIGYKFLTNADLGRSISHQTHIGLFDDVLTFLPNEVEIDDALFIYNNKCDTVLLSFDRITRKNGDINSPKIKCGGRGVISVVSSIRDIVKQQDQNLNLNWFLFWFGLASEQPIFFLFNNDSQTFKDINTIGIKLTDNVKGRITSNDNFFTNLMSYLENIVNRAGSKFIRELEVASQTSYIIKLKNKKIFRPRFYDIERANKIFKEIGRKGEELINIHLNKCKQENVIQRYNWLNENMESGLPYDFTIQENNDEIVYLDVKSTNFDFEQKIIFSGQELDFIANTENNYKIYRVFGLNDQVPLLKICNSSKEHIKNINLKVGNFKQDISRLNTELEALKIAIYPNKSFIFDNEIRL